MPTIIDNKGTTHELPVILHGNGLVSDFRPEGGEFTLGELQKAVGGLIEIVRVEPWSDIILIVDEEGRLKRKRCNELASEMVGRYIVGDVVLMERKDF